jgi:hypothetical protein
MFADFLSASNGDLSRLGNGESTEIWRKKRITNDSLCVFESSSFCYNHIVMKGILQNLIRLQSIEFSEIKNENDEIAMSELRNKIPPQILNHYDRLVARGKKGIAAVRHQTCAGCHMNVPLGAVLTLRHGDDIQLCGNCGRYLYLDESAEIVKPVKKKPARHKAAQLASA